MHRRRPQCSSTPPRCSSPEPGPVPKGASAPAPCMAARHARQASKTLQSGNKATGLLLQADKVKRREEHVAVCALARPCTQGGSQVLLVKRPSTGLLAGVYQPEMSGHCLTISALAAVHLIVGSSCWIAMRCFEPRSG